MRDGSYQVNYTVAAPSQIPVAPKPVVKTFDPNANPMGGLRPELYDLMGPKQREAIVRAGENGGGMEWLKFAMEHADGELHLPGIPQIISLTHFSFYFQTLSTSSRSKVNSSMSLAASSEFLNTTPKIFSTNTSLIFVIHPTSFPSCENSKMQLNPVRIIHLEQSTWSSE